jgi:2-dehydropantoate 2-reductase
MRILIVGAGAVGGYFGARWIAAGRDATFLVRDGRRATLAKTGLTVLGLGQDLHVEPRAMTAPELNESFDLVFITVTGDALQAALTQIAPAIGPATSIITALNGVRHFDMLRDKFGPDSVLGSVVKCVTKLDEEGRIIALTKLAQIAFGSWSGQENERLQAVHTALSADGIDVQISPHIREEIFEKWLLMIALGAANSLLNGDVGTINAEPRGAWAIQEILREGQRGLTEIGMRPRDSAVEAMARLFSDTASRQTSSLYRNMAAGRRIELEPIIGDFLDRVADHGAYPLISAAYARLAIYMRSKDS